MYLKYICTIPGVPIIIGHKHSFDNIVLCNTFHEVNVSRPEIQHYHEGLLCHGEREYVCPDYLVQGYDHLGEDTVSPQGIAMLLGE